MEVILPIWGGSRPRRAPIVPSKSLRGLALPLKMAAKVDPMDQQYFSSVIEPLLDDPLIDFIGELGDEQKKEFLGNATALLFPINWPEPFGLVMIEALAMGTPVIAWPMGSAPEVIEDGVTGLLVGFNRCRGTSGQTGAGRWIAEQFGSVSTNGFPQLGWREIMSLHTKSCSARHLRFRCALYGAVKLASLPSTRGKVGAFRNFDEQSLEDHLYRRRRFKRDLHLPNS